MAKRSRIINSLPLTILKVYKKSVSPLLVMLLGGSCRFQPTCSEYAKSALKKYGLIRGSLLSIFRVLRCNPLNKGGYDPA